MVWNRGRFPLLEIYVDNQNLLVLLKKTVVAIKFGKINNLYRTFEYFPKVRQCIHSLQKQAVKLHYCLQLVQTMRGFVFNLHTLIYFFQLEKHINTNSFSSVESMLAYKRQGKIHSL